MDIPRRTLSALGIGLIGLSAVLGLIALEHLRTLAAYGYICGGAQPHCPACPASIAAMLLGLAVLAFAARTPRRRVTIED